MRSNRASWQSVQGGPPKGRSVLDAPERAKPRDHGWKSRGICVDGPLAGIGIGRRIEANAEVRVRVESEGKVARYRNVGPGHGVPPADGVAFKFLGYVGEETAKK